MCCFKVNSNTRYINRKAMNCRIPKKYPLYTQGLCKKLEAGEQKTKEWHCAKLIGYQMQPFL